MASVITGDDIQHFRLKVIKQALRLESIGMRGRVNAAVIARQILNKVGLKASRNKKELLVQFSDYINSLEEVNHVAVQ